MLNTQLPSEPEISLLVFTQEREKQMYMKTCTQMFIAALFILAQVGGKKKPENKKINVYQWLNKQIAIHLQNGILLSNKKEQTPNTHNNQDESRK